MLTKSQSSPPEKRRRTIFPGGFPLAATGMLLLTAALALLWSYNKLMWMDEFLVLRTDIAGGFREIAHIQRVQPISLDPLAYHFASHLCTLIFGANAFAIRLPSLCGFLVMQFCLFFFARHIAGNRAAVIAMALPALTGTLYYATEGRPYGMLLGVFGIAALSYQAATRRIHTRPALVCLALSLALAPNTHYFGVLLFVPIVSAEFVRTLLTRRFDWPVIAAIALGLLGLLAILPLQPALRPFRQHYYNIGAINVHTIVIAYRNLLIDFFLPGTILRLMMIAIVLCGIIVLATCFRLRHRAAISLPWNEFVFLLILAGLPILGYFLGRFVTHSMELRYVLGALLGISALTGIAIGASLRKESAYRATIACLAIAIVVVASCHIRVEAANTAAIRASLAVSPEMKQRLLHASPDGLIYIGELNDLERECYYGSDPDFCSHLVAVYSPDEELKFFHRNTASLGAEHESHFTHIRFARWEQLEGTGPHTLISSQSAWDWTRKALAAEHAQITHLGTALGGNALQVSIPATSDAPAASVLKK
ncbi:MAG TPA: glycosyltransferase family 39 protein [Acidobacteriaceae bacterium]|nr:glycosyltransferase family 39 protein [Acidobacteriaceae bacterium]